MSPDNSDETVLVVDDESDVADVYALRLQTQYSTRVAYGGEEALEEVDEDVDVMLLDRRMPDLTGDEVLAEVRDRDLDCRVVMVTAVDPDFDIVEMPFDDYLCKPVDSDDLMEAIEQQLSATSYDEFVREYMEVTSKISLLEAEKPAQELEDNDEIEQLRERADELREKLDQTVEGFDDPASAFQDLV